MRPPRRHHLAHHTTAAPTTTLPPTTTVAAFVERQIRSSVEGRPITVRDVERRVGVWCWWSASSTAAAEDDGVAIVDLLERLPVPDGVDLWLVRSMNPDGQAAQDRHNANQVDLNRSFPADWGPIGVPGDSPSPVRRRRAGQTSVSGLRRGAAARPDHLVPPRICTASIPEAGARRRSRARCAELTGLPLVSITGGTYTGVAAATWARRTIEPGVAFIVELGGTLSAEEAAMHAQAVLTVAGEPN
ncbi:MAG: M14 family zinc carboxypeptidase [Ilumatobacteraceae bacterium]